MKKRALITGINGMDGSHLADLLLAKDYKVYGLERKSDIKNRINTAHLEGKVTFITGNLTDQKTLLESLKVSSPDEVYNLAAQSFVGESWNAPEKYANITGLGALRMLEAVRQYGKNIKYYQASSSEMFGRLVENPAKEDTPFNPRSPYGVSKLYAHWITKNYRETYNMFNCSGILFNHESERRGLEFVTRKITNGVAKIKLGLSDHIVLGNLESRRDWGYAPDYVEAMWSMMQQNKPKDYVIATGKTHSIREFLDLSFKEIGIHEWSNYVKQDPKFMRPSEVDVLRGDSSMAKQDFGWTPRTSFERLVKIMIHKDIERLTN